jgi:protein O-GlcNAc transferase
VRFAHPAEPALKDHADAPMVLIDLQGMDHEEHILKVIRTSGTFYEADLLGHLARNGPRGGTYVDVGANIGNHSVFFGRFLADHVVAVEPNPELLPILHRNIRVNGVACCTVLPVALGAHPGTGRMRLREGYEGNAGAPRVEAAYGAAPVRDGMVRVVRLDDALAALESALSRDVRLVKLDIEGMELEALQGAAELLDRQGPDLVVEAAGDEDHAGIVSFLAEYGYEQVAALFCRTPTYHFQNPVSSFPRGLPQPLPTTTERPAGGKE